MGSYVVQDSESWKSLGSLYSFSHVSFLDISDRSRCTLCLAMHCSAKADICKAVLDGRGRDCRKLANEDWDEYTERGNKKLLSRNQSLSMKYV